MAIKRLTTVLFVSCLVGATLVSGAASGHSRDSAAPRNVPKVVQIEDLAGDANFLNGQHYLPIEGDTTTPVDLTVPDILRVWFTNDAKTISVHIQTEAPPPAPESAYNFYVGVDPSGGDIFGGNRCLYFDIIVEGPTWVGGPLGRFYSCHGQGGPVNKGSVTTIEAADGTGITTMTLPRSADPAFADGEILESPRVWTYQWNGERNPTRSAALAVVDDTKPGKDYVIARR